MKILHLADLHIGKRVNGYSMIEDQAFALGEIAKLAKKEEVKVTIIAGDVYDLTNPSVEAMTVFDDFIVEILEFSKVIIVAGNHDSSERLGFLSSILQKEGLYISRSFNGQVEKITFEDEFGPINFYLIPYLKPINVKRFYPDAQINTFEEALDFLVQQIDINDEERNIAISHQYIVGAKLSESEEIYLGGTEAVSFEIYTRFDYAAMGHIHKKWATFDGRIRYPGSLLKYSKSESGNHKTITILDFNDKENLDIIEHEINYLRDMRSIKGEFDAIIDQASRDENRDDYIHITLYDQDEVLNALPRLKAVYPNLMTLAYENMRSQTSVVDEINLERNKDPLELFEDFYEYRNNQKLDENKRKFIVEAIEEIWGNK